MWVVRDRFVGDLENPLESFEAARSVARTYSHRGYPLIEVVRTDNLEVVLVFVDGREFVENKSVRAHDFTDRVESSSSPMSLDAATIQSHGRAVWERLASKHVTVMRLRRKLESLSPQEQQLLNTTAVQIRDTESDLRTILSENEFICCFVKFVQSANPSWFGNTTLNYCDRQIRRYVAQALKKTGQASLMGQWSNEFVSTKPSMSPAV